MSCDQQEIDRLVEAILQRLCKEGAEQGGGGTCAATVEGRCDDDG